MVVASGLEGDIATCSIRAVRDCFASQHGRDYTNFTILNSDVAPVKACIWLDIPEDQS